MAKNDRSLNLGDSNDSTEDSVENTPHELFLPEDGGKPLKPIAYIHIARFDGSQKYQHPRLIPADEMPDLETLHRRFGGGRYEITGRDETKRHIVTKRAITLAGKSKPLDNLDDSEDEESVPVVTPQQASNMTGGVVGGLAGLAPVFAVIVPMIIQWMQNSQAQSLKQTEAQALMFKSILEQSKDSSREFISSMQAMYSAQIQMLTTSRPSEDGPSNPNDFMKGIEFMQQFTEANREALVEQAGAAGADDPMKMIETLMGAMQMFKGLPGLADGNPIGNAGGNNGTPPVTT